MVAQFNIFEAIGVVRQEIRHSNFLAFLLNPSGTHRLGDTFLKRFLKRILLNVEKPQVSPVEIDVANLLDAEVRREWKNIDVLVYSPSSRVVCVIENKVGSQEHSDQLRRYREIILKEFKGYRHIFIYLTPEGQTPVSEDDSKVWLVHSYDKIAELIDDTCRRYQSTIGSEIYTLMSHYSSLIRRHIAKDSEIAELCRKIYKQHKQALDLIYEHRPNLASEVADFAKKLIQDAESHGLRLDSYSNSKNLVRFCVAEWDDFPFQRTCNNWAGSKRILRFEFKVEPSEVILVLTIGPGNLSIRQDIYNALAAYNIAGFTAVKPENEKGWIYIIKQPIMEVIDPEVSIDGVVGEIQDFWEHFLTIDLPVIKKAITEKISPLS
ncbi:PD-(D/E)XK nuclease family protein [Coleofasciculus sp. H7-2]|uniref:PDDEXK-like family protein n=1 Tax=Coleofasciculus sp. H7-2 TaxID=3351545 RepID=UPI00367201EB